MEERWDPHALRGRRQKGAAVLAVAQNTLVVAQDETCYLTTQKLHS